MHSEPYGSRYIYTLEAPTHFQGAAHHELVPLLLLGRVQQLRLGGRLRSNACTCGCKQSMSR